LVIDRAFWKGRRVFLTGHTGFKGGWLSLWLKKLGAVVGYTLDGSGQGEIDGETFSADLADETLRRTSLQRLRAGSLVNLELPTRAQDRLGGHVVQGHVDGVGSIVSLQKIKYRDDWRLVIELPAEIARYVVPQGSITVEGISLTVAAIEQTRVEIAIIPHTWQATNLRALRQGDPVNIEVDVLAKYAEKLARGRPSRKLAVDDLIRQGY